MVNAHDDWSARQRQLWDLEHELQRLDAVLARTSSRKGGGSLTDSQAEWVRSGVEADAAPLRAKIAALRQIDELVMGQPTVIGSPDDPAADWELLWRLRSLRGPLNWSIRRESAANNATPVAQAARILGAQGDALPAGVRRFLTTETNTGVGRLNAKVAEAVTKARVRRKRQSERRSA